MAKKKQPEIPAEESLVCIPGLEFFLAGFHTAAAAAKQTNSVAMLSIGVRRPGFPLSYVNVELSTDLKSGLTKLVSMQPRLQSSFQKGTGGSRVLSSAIKPVKSGKPGKGKLLSFTDAPIDPVESQVDSIMNTIT